MIVVGQDRDVTLSGKRIREVRKQNEVRRDAKTDSLSAEASIEKRDSCSLPETPQIIYNATWIPTSKYVKLKETWIRQSSQFSNVSIISVFEKIADVPERKEKVDL